LKNLRTPLGYQRDCQRANGEGLIVSAKLSTLQNNISLGASYLGQELSGGKIVTIVSK